jgi:hypothetical protein
LVPTGASFASSTGSPRSTLVLTTRSTNDCGSLIAPGGTLPLGQSTVLSI